MCANCRQETLATGGPDGTPPSREKAGEQGRHLGFPGRLAGTVRAATGAAIDCVLDTIDLALAKGEEVCLADFGTFAVKDGAVRTRRNLRIGETLSIPVSKRPSFEADKALRDAVKGE